MQNLVKIEIPEEFEPEKQDLDSEILQDIEDINKSYCSCKNCQD